MKRLFIGTIIVKDRKTHESKCYAFANISETRDESVGQAYLKSYDIFPENEYYNRSVYSDDMTSGIRHLLSLIDDPS